MPSSPPHAVETLVSPPKLQAPAEPSSTSTHGRDGFIAAALAICDRRGPDAVTARNVDSLVKTLLSTRGALWNTLSSRQSPASSAKSGLPRPPKRRQGGSYGGINVAKEVRKSPMAVYRHFKSMDHLMATVWNAAYDLMHREMEQTCRQITHPAAALRQRLVSFLDFGAAHPHLAWFIIATRPQPERFGMENPGRQGFARLGALIRRGMEVGCFRKDIDPQQAALNASYLMIGMTSFVAAKAVSGATDLDQAAKLENTVDWYLDDLKPRHQ